MENLILGSNKLNDNSKRERGKIVLQFWNGGANSTYLLLQNLLCGNSVVLNYVENLHNLAKRQREIDAQESLKKDIAIFCEYYDCLMPTYSDNSEIFALTDFYNQSLYTQQIIISLFSLIVGKEFDEVQIGNSFGHCATDFHKELIELCNKYFGASSHVTFPLENASKDTIYLTLQSYDKLLGTKFIQHITVCDNLDEQCGRTLKCWSCIDQHMLFHRLKWI